MRRLLLTGTLGTVAALTTGCALEPLGPSTEVRMGTSEPTLLVWSGEDLATPMTIGAGDALGQAIFARQIAIARAQQQQRQRFADVPTDTVDPRGD